MNGLYILFAVVVLGGIVVSLSICISHDLNTAAQEETER